MFSGSRKSWVPDDGASERIPVSRDLAAATINPHRLAALAWAVVRHAGSAARRYLIFIVRFLDCGSRAPLDVRLSWVGINACPSLVERPELESQYSRTRK